MNSVRIKICGITTLDDALACAEAGAEYVGFVFHRASPRYLEPAHAAEIVAQLPARVIPVGVFVNEPPSSLREIVRISGVRVAQLSGDEHPSHCAGAPVPVVKALRAWSEGATGHSAGSYGVYARLADGGGPGSYGGTGQEADAGFARSLAALGRLFLAGGLTPANVCARILEVRPFAVDVSGGVERAPGVKDRALVRLFCSAVRWCTAN